MDFQVATISQQYTNAVLEIQFVGKNEFVFSAFIITSAFTRTQTPLGEIAPNHDSVSLVLQMTVDTVVPFSSFFLKMALRPFLMRFSLKNKQTKKQKQNTDASLRACVSSLLVVVYQQFALSLNLFKLILTIHDISLQFPLNTFVYRLVKVDSTPLLPQQMLMLMICNAIFINKNFLMLSFIHYYQLYCISHKNMGEQQVPLTVTKLHSTSCWT